jgi:acyl-CoA carboxylase epsilon subunit
MNRDDSEEPFLYVVRGNAAPDEIAALVVVLLNRDSEQDAHQARRGPRRRRAIWAFPAHQHRHPWHGRYPDGHGS